MRSSTTSVCGMEIKMSYNIAIDGPAGAGKSTIARAVAEKMNLIYVDTGAMYRAMALFMLREGMDLQDTEGIAGKCQEADITIRYEDGVQVVCLNGENVNGFLRTEEVGNAASVVSVIPQVRKKLVELQKKLAAERDCIMDGRDIGTCVLPGAQVKIYLTASSRVRAKRRFDELTAKGQECDLEKIREDIEERDFRDMHRETSPLVQAEDAILVDTSDMTKEEVIGKIISLCGC
jgi:cytidylate kinase